jgi:hypothetical protein
LGILTTTACTSFVFVSAASDTSGGGGAVALEYAVDFDGNAFALEGESVWTVSQPTNENDTAISRVRREMKTTGFVEFEGFAHS